MSLRERNDQVGFLMLKITARQMALEEKETRQRRAGDGSAESRSQAAKTSVSYLGKGIAKT